MAGMKIMASARSTICAAICQANTGLANWPPRPARPRMQRGIARQEGGIDGAFAENGAEILGNRKATKRRPTAPRPEVQASSFAHKTGDARQQRKAADRKKPFEHQCPLRRLRHNRFTSGSMRATMIFTPGRIGMHAVGLVELWDSSPPRPA